MQVKIICKILQILPHVADFYERPRDMFLLMRVIQESCSVYGVIGTGIKTGHAEGT